MIKLEDIKKKTDQIVASAVISIQLKFDCPKGAFINIDVSEDKLFLVDPSTKMREEIADITEASAFVIEEKGVRLLYSVVKGAYWIRTNKEKLEVGSDPKVAVDVFNYLI